MRVVLSIILRYPTQCLTIIHYIILLVNRIILINKYKRLLMPRNNDVTLTAFKKYIRVLDKVKAMSSLERQGHPELIADATHAFKELRSMLGRIQTYDNDDGNKVTKWINNRYGQLREDHHSGRSRWYPSFLMVVLTDGSQTTLDNALSNESIRYNNNSNQWEMFMPSISYANMGLCYSSSKRIEELTRKKLHLPNEKVEVEEFKFTNFPAVTFDNTLYMGVELEVVRKSSTPKDIILSIYSDLNNCSFKDGRGNVSFAFCKSDGSLPSHGLEIVSAPATLAYHQIAWNKFFDNSAKHLVSWGNTKCGMHIHVSKQGFNNELHIGKLVKFINSNENKTFIRIMAGRNPNSYTRFNDAKKIKDYYLMKVKGLMHEGNRPLQDSGHYECVNLFNKNTVELRIFRGNTRKEGFFKNIEFTHAAVEFTRQASIKELTQDAFLKWLDQPANTKTYSILAKWLKARDLANMKYVKLYDTIPDKCVKKDIPLKSHYLNDAA